MYIQLKNQEEIIKQAVNKAGSYRKLSKILKIPRSSLAGYGTLMTIPENRFRRIMKFLEIKADEIKIKRLENNWKQIIGGKNCVKSKRNKGTFEKDLKKAQKNGALKLKEWHKKMKEEHPKEYYLSQYSKFKKIGGYKYKTARGEKVRNKFEKEVADILNKLNIRYKYEPLINIKNTYFFPDFLIEDKVVIEATAWKGKIKAYKLREKIKKLKEKYEVYVVIPKNLYRYYKILNNHLILGLDEFVPVAQTFCAVKGRKGAIGRAHDC